MHSDLTLASLPPFLAQIPSLSFFNSYISCPIFSPLLSFLVTSFIFVGLRLLSILSLSALRLGPKWTCWCTVELSALTGDKKEREKHFRKEKRPRPEDYRRPLSLLVQRHLTQHAKFFFTGLSDSSSGGLNVSQIDSLNDGGPSVIATNYFRQQRKCY